MGNERAKQIADRVAMQRFEATRAERALVRNQLAKGVQPSQIDTPARAKARLDIASAVVPELSTHEGGVGLERVINQPDFLSTAFLVLGAERSRSVACIKQQGSGIGTGWMMAKGLLITNAHVLRNENDAMMCRAEFGYEHDAHGAMVKSVAFDFDPQSFFISSPVNELDYTVVAVKPRSVDGAHELGEYGYLRLIARSGKALLGEWINVIQHPDGRPKAVALRNNKLMALKGSYLHYETDTQPGSSGAPTFNDQWEVVGLHHAGVAKRDENNAYVLRDGRTVPPELMRREDEPLVQWIGNEGIRISRIIPDLWSRADAKGLARLLVGVPQPDFSDVEDESVGSGRALPRPTAPVPVLGTSARTTKEPSMPIFPAEEPARDSSRPSSSASISIGVPSSMPSNDIVIEVPLRVTIRVSVAATGSDVSTDRGISSFADGSPRVIDEQEALRLLEEGRRRVYFDQSQDEADKRSYYQAFSIDAADAKSSLQRLLTRTHARLLDYNRARIEHLYAWVDLQRDKKVRSLYSNKLYDPERFIRQDFEIERRVEGRLLEARRFESNISADALERMRLELEANDPFNCEHVVPQSWFGKAEPMRGDLHHLFACESTCNSTRSNHPYTDHGVFDIENRTYRDCGHLQDGEFEPYMGKGKAARAVLYFLVRYPGKANKTNKEYRGDQIAMLLDWHDRYPPTEHEFHRNQAIFRIQGNRNPFIDYPEWAHVIFG